MAKSEIAELIEVQRHTNELIQKLINVTLNMSGNIALMRENEGLPGLSIDIEDFVEIYNKFDSTRLHFNWLSVHFWRSKPRIAPEELEIDRMIKCNDLIQGKLEREMLAKDLDKYKATIKTEDQYFKHFNSKQVLRILSYLGHGKDATKLSGQDRIEKILKHIKSFDFKEWKKREYAVDPVRFAKVKDIHVFVEPEKK